MKCNFNEQVNLLLEHIDKADAVCVGAAAGKIGRASCRERVL